MLGFSLGILSAAGAGGVAGDYELIQTQIVAGTSTSSVTFSNLANFNTTYRHLQLRATFRTSHSSFEGMRMRINNDSGNNYARHGLFANGNFGTVQGFGVTSDNRLELVDAPNSLSVTGNFAASVCDILDAYSTTKNKTIRAFNGMEVGSTSTRVVLHSGVRLNTEAVSSLVLSFPTGNIVAGSRFSLYGIRG